MLLVHPGTSRGMFLQIIASRKTVPPKMFLIVPFGDFHIFFKLNSGIKVSIVKTLILTDVQFYIFLIRHSVNYSELNIVILKNGPFSYKYELDMS